MENDKKIKVYNREILKQSLILTGCSIVTAISATNMILNVTTGTFDTGMISLSAATGLVAGCIGYGAINDLVQAHTYKKEYRRRYGKKV